MKKVIVVLAYVIALISMVIFTLKSVNALDIPITISSEKVVTVSAGYKKQINWPATQKMINNPDYVPAQIANPEYDPNQSQYIENPAYGDPNEPAQIPNPEYIEPLMINPEYDSEVHAGIPSMRLETIVERFQSDVEQWLVNMANAGNLKIALENAKDEFVPLTDLE